MAPPRRAQFTLGVKAQPAKATMSDNNAPHAQLEQQPPLPEGATCKQCEHALNMTRGAGYWHGQWYCLPCLAKGRR